MARIELATPSLPRKCSTPELHWLSWWGEQDSNLRRHTPADLQSAPVGRFGISPTFLILRADGGIRTPDQLITNQLLWPTELHRHCVKD